MTYILTYLLTYFQLPTSTMQVMPKHFLAFGQQFAFLHSEREAMVLVEKVLSESVLCC